MTVFVYLCYGRSPAAERELRYSLETLRAEVDREAGLGGERARTQKARRWTSVFRGFLGGAGRRRRGFSGYGIAVYSDRPEVFADLDATLVDVSPLLAQARAGGYAHRLKPMVLADALRRFRRACVLLDLDSFIRPGFADDVAGALGKGAAMNVFVRRDPYPFFPEFATRLPHLGAYRLDRDKAIMLNSGLVAVRPEHLPLVEDAVTLIDRLWAAGLCKHDVEQFALAETLRLGGVAIALIDRSFEHYCARWARRYMRRRLRLRARGVRIPYSRARVRLFKAYWTLRLAMRNARRSWRGLWRKT